MMKVDHADRLGNDKYYGYAIDLLNAMSDLHQFVFEIRTVADGQFGSRRVDGAWNGMVRYLIEGVCNRCESYDVIASLTTTRLISREILLWRLTMI